MYMVNLFCDLLLFQYIDANYILESDRNDCVDAIQFKPIHLCYNILQVALLVKCIHSIKSFFHKFCNQRLFRYLWPTVYGRTKNWATSNQYYSIERRKKKT